MKSRFHEAANAELTEAILYYDAKAPGFGDRFLAGVKAAARRIEQFPESAQAIDLGVRDTHATPSSTRYNERRCTR